MKKELDMTRQLIVEEVDRVAWTEKEIYASFLAQTYYYVRHSTRLLALAASRLDIQEGGAFRRFVKHIQEENNHERLAEMDLKALGYSVSDFHELESTQAFYRMQYYYLQNGSPWSLMGYIYPLEALAVERGHEVAGQSKALWGEGCIHFLKLHGAEDVDHLEEAMKMINSLSPDKKVAVTESLKMSRYLYLKVLTDLPLARVGVHPAGKKAA